MKQKLFPLLIAFSALAVSCSAAFYSITGLSKLFAGASTEVIIMASSLEIAKLVMASLLYQYWDKLNKLLKVYLTVALVVLIGITSAGIYGFLSSAYQDTANKASVVDKETQVYKVKKERFATGSTTQSVDAKTGQVVTKANNANRKTFESQLNTALQNKEIVDSKITSANDSITALDMKILEIESKAELAGELGPLKYLSNITGKPMDQIINWFLLIIIFVFDPLAICLVIAANFAFKQKEYTIYETPTPDPVVEHKPQETHVPQKSYVFPSAPLIQKIFRKKNRKDDDDNIIKYT